MLNTNLIANMVRDFWKNTLFRPEPVIVFFYQKYEYETENKWEKVNILVDCNSDSDMETVIFDYDFCEGQTNIKDITICTLREVIDFFSKNKLKR